MTWPIVFTAAAQQDLEDIADFIARDSPKRGLTFVAELRACCNRIAEFAEAAPVRPELGEGVRMVPQGSYLILYALRASSVVIERIVHGSRDVAALPLG